MKMQRVHFGDMITRSPGKTLMIIVVVTLFMFLINMDPGIIGKEQYDEADEDAWLPDNKIGSTIDDLNNNYGSNVMYLQMFFKGENDNVLTKEALVYILEFEKKIAENEKVQNVLYPQPGNISSISSAIATNIILQNESSNFSYDNMINELNKLNQEDINEIFTQYGNQVSFFMSKDFKDNIKNNNVKAEATIMLVMLDSNKYDEIEDDDNPILDADLEIKDIIDETEFKGVKYVGLLENEYVEHIINTEAGMGNLLLAVIIIIVVILFLTYRSVLDTILSLMAIFFAIIWMNGIGIMLGLTFSNLYEAVPIILIGLGIDYAIHMTLRYKEGITKEGRSIRGAMLLAITTVGASLFLSALTTGLSFASNIVSEMKPMREFGIFLMVGIICCFVIVVTLIPSVKMIADSHKSKRKHKHKNTNGSSLNSMSSHMDMEPTDVKKHKHNIIEKGMVKIAHISATKPYPIIVIVIIISAISASFAVQLEMEYDFKEFLPTEHQITDDISYLYGSFDFGRDEADILIRIRGEVTNPDVLIAMNETQNKIMDDSHLNEKSPIFSILILMQGAASTEGDIFYNETFANMYNERDTDNDSIPDKDIDDLFRFLLNHDDYKHIAINVLYYNPDTDRFEGTLIRVGVNSKGGNYNGEITDEMEKNIVPFKNMENIEAIATGGPILEDAIISSIMTSGLKSLVITVIIAAIILTALFGYEYRSITLGLLTELPVILVIMWIYGTMFLMGVPLTVMTIMICTISIGVGIDYAIHVTNRFMESIHDFGNVDEALESTIVNTGGALFGAAMTTIGGFGILYFAPINPFKMFGTFTALAIGYSLIATIIALPAFLGIYARRKMRKEPDYFEHHVDISKVREHIKGHVHGFGHIVKEIEKKVVEEGKKIEKKVVETGVKVGEHAVKAKDKAVVAGAKVGEHAVKAKDKVVDTGVKVGEHAIKAKDKVVETGAKVGEHAVKAKDKVVETGAKVGGHAVKAKDKVVETGAKVGGHAVKAKDRVVETGIKVGDTAKKAKDKVVDRVKKDKQENEEE